ncbi:MAG: PqqD family protein [Actinomycetia bacterium]|nr:PqqD family protein [Actinomycetes bacterium]
MVELNACLTLVVSPMEMQERGDHMSESSLSTHSLVSARPELLSTGLSSTEVVLLDMDSGRCFGMDAVANTIWKPIKEPRTVDEVCDAVLAAFETPRNEVESDALSFLAELGEAGLAQVHEGPSRTLRAQRYPERGDRGCGTSRHGHATTSCSSSRRPCWSVRRASRSAVSGSNASKTCWASVSPSPPARSRRGSCGRLA